MKILLLLLPVITIATTNTRGQLSCARQGFLGTANPRQCPAPDACTGVVKRQDDNDEDDEDTNDEDEEDDDDNDNDNKV